MSKENPIEKAFVALNLGGEKINSFTDNSLSFKSRRLIAEGLYPQKNKNKRKPKPTSPRFAPLPEFEKRS